MKEEYDLTIADKGSDLKAYTDEEIALCRLYYFKAYNEAMQAFTYDDLAVNRRYQRTVYDWTDEEIMAKPIIHMLFSKFDEIQNKALFQTRRIEREEKETILMQYTALKYVAQRQYEIGVEAARITDDVIIRETLEFWIEFLRFAKFNPKELISLFKPVSQEAKQKLNAAYENSKRIVAKD